MASKKKFKKGTDYEEFKHKEYKYRLVKEHIHVYIVDRPIFIKGVKPGANGAKMGKYVEFHRKSVTLHKGFKWNGSDIVQDSPECMRASAVHDAWCRGMDAGILKNNRKNWNKGVDEYIRICKKDGLVRFERKYRKGFMKLGGFLKFLFD